MQEMIYEDLKDWKYRVLEGFDLQTDILPDKPIKTAFSSLDQNGLLTIDKGFCWDGASGAIDTYNIIRGSCVHDAFCNWFDKKLITLEEREKADKILKALILQDGMGDFRAGIIYGAVKINTSIRYKLNE